MTADLPFNRFAICDAAYIYAHHTRPEHGAKIFERLERLQYKPSLSVRRAAEAAHYGVFEHPISRELDRKDYRETRVRLARLLRAHRKLDFCDTCGLPHTQVAVAIVYPPADPENGPSPSDLDSWEEIICIDCALIIHMDQDDVIH